MQCHDIVETISMKHGEVVLFVPHLVWIRRGYGTNYSAWLEHAGFNSSKANHCGLHRLCPQLFCLRFCFACDVLYVASSVLECRIHYLDLSVLRPGGYGNLARKGFGQGAKDKRLGCARSSPGRKYGGSFHAHHYGQAAWALLGKKGCHNAYRWAQ